MWYSFLYLKNVKIRIHGVPLWPSLVCKISEFLRWKLWDQNFVPFDSGNIKESKKNRFYFFSRVENQICLFSWSKWNKVFKSGPSNTKQTRFRRAASCLNQNMISRIGVRFNILFLKSYFGFNKMLFFGIVFVLYFFELSGKSSF